MIAVCSNDLNVPVMGPKFPMDIVHLLFGLSEDFSQMPFSLIHYLSILFIKFNLKPKKIYLHFQFLPHGTFFDQVRPYLILNKVVVPNEIYGQKFGHVAHKADLLRLQILQKFGGMVWIRNCLA